MNAKPFFKKFAAYTAYSAGIYAMTLPIIYWGNGSFPAHLAQCNVIIAVLLLLPVLKNFGFTSGILIGITQGYLAFTTVSQAAYIDHDYQADDPVTYGWLILVTGYLLLIAYLFTAGINKVSGINLKTLKI